jgi:hypothetical protein
MKNRDLLLKDPTKSELLNNGVAQVRDIQNQAELQTLRYELTTFVCEGHYAKGLSRILQNYLQNLDQPEQPAVWVSGFFGSGKSHLVKMLRYLWVDYEFPGDKATARGITKLPEEIKELLRELSTAGRRFGELHAAAGTLSGGADSVRLTLLGILFNSLGLPDKYPLARFIMWLKRRGIYEQFKQRVENAGKTLDKELTNLYVSSLIAQALLTIDPEFATSAAEAKSLIKNQFPDVKDISSTEMVEAINEALTLAYGRFPCTLIVLDEIQQFIADNAERTLKVQEVVEDCSKKFGGQLLFVGTGQTALSGTPQLQKLTGRFRIYIQLSDTDVETVIRKVVLAKKPDKMPQINETLGDCSGEISRHLVGTKIEPRPEDREFDAADYPLLPVRNRFWERTLRAVDQAGTSGQLRTQLKIVHEAVKRIADQPLGSVVAGDFIFEQVATDLLQSGVLLPEIHELILKQRDGSPDGDLRARLCSLIFLIGKLPREAGSDIGLRATPDALADLLVEDLRAGSADLRKRIPELLQGLLDAGQIIRIEDEYRLQTRESQAWDADFRNRQAKIRNDDQRLASERADLLRNQCGERLKNLKLSHGKSNVKRELRLSFDKQAPDDKGPTIPVWVRDGWNEDEKSLLADVRKAGTDSPLIYIFIPRRNNDELKEAIATLRAADETLNARGFPSTPAGLEARRAMETRKQTAESALGNLLEDVFNGARVFLAGGGEYPGFILNTMTLDAAKDALLRLYPNFDVADDTRWEKVKERAKNGSGSPLEAIGHTAETEQHSVCAAVLKQIGAGKKGSELRRYFMGSPYGWPQDAVDGAIFALFAAGKIKVSQDGRPLDIKQLDQTKIGVAEFRTESATVTTAQRIAIRKLFQQAGVGCKPNEESVAAGAFLNAMLSLADSAGGDPPLPLKPDVRHFEDCRNLMGNEQLLAIYQQEQRLAQEIQDWQRLQILITNRFPRWGTLQRLLGHARGLAEFDEISQQAKAIAAQRSLLADPDPIPALCEGLTNALREQLVQLSDTYRTAYQAQMTTLNSSANWQKLALEQQSQILDQNGIATIPEVKVGNEADLLRSLDQIGLEGWRMRSDALLQRFDKATMAAARLLEPKAVRVTIPTATLRSEAEVEEWLSKVREEIIRQLQDGPVII